MPRRNRNHKSGPGVVVAAIAITLTHAPCQARANELGEYLASECTSCHQLSGSSQGIPSIVRINPEIFVQAMRQYASGKRDNPVMQSVARSLNKEETEALAEFFSKQGGGK